MLRDSPKSVHRLPRANSLSWRRCLPGCDRGHCSRGSKTSGSQSRVSRDCPCADGRGTPRGDLGGRFFNVENPTCPLEEEGGEQPNQYAHGDEREERQWPLWWQVHKLQFCLRSSLELSCCSLEVNAPKIVYAVTDTQRAKLIAKRKAAYEAVRPKTKYGGAPGKAGGGKANVAKLALFRFRHGQ
jgi:hypothetical protein